MKKMTILMYALDFLIILSLSFVILYNIVCNTKNKINEMDFSFHFATTKVISDSMEPFINTNEYVLIKKITTEDEIYISTKNSNKGVYVYVDENLFENKRTYIIHRCVGITENGEYIFQGDNNEDVDPWYVKREMIIGEFVKVQKTSISVQEYITITTVFLCSIFILCSILLNVYTNKKGNSNDI